MFRFENIDYLYLLLVVPVLIVVFEVAMTHRKALLARLGKKDIINRLMPEASPRRQRAKFLILSLALVFMILAIARPQFGSKLKEVEREGVEIMFAIDVSNSMLAQDFEPNRLERTKYAVSRIIEGLTEDKIGVIVFAGDAYVQLPITSDYVTARNFVSQISTSIVSKQGTSIGEAISLATSSFSSQSENSRVIILVTDGENHEADAIKAAEVAASRGIKIYTIGIGTPEGAPIQIGEDFIRDAEGEIVVSKLDEEGLEKIALATGGAYIRSTTQSVGMAEIIAQINATQKAEFATEVFEEFDEQYQYPLAIALALLLLEFSILSRKNRLLAKFNIFQKKKK